MKHFLFLLFSLLFILKSNCQEIEENWDTYMASYEKGAGSVLLNMSLKERAPLLNYGYAVITGVKLKDCTPDGLPTQQEFKTLYKISDGVHELIEKKKRTILAGTFTYQCERTDYFYVNDTFLLRKYLTEFYETNFPQYSFIISIKADRKWESYLSFLYPNDEIMESMLNQKVVLKLHQAGDKLEKQRTIDHWLYFKTEGGRNRFISYAAGLHFKIEKTDTVAEQKQYPFSLQISRTDYADLARITQLTLMLRKEAMKQNGYYDGWETAVIKD
jgi:hypothetical protein